VLPSSEPLQLIIETEEVAWTLHLQPNWTDV
jgi:hypothetical protein